MRARRLHLGPTATIAAVVGTIAIAVCIFTITFQVLLTPLPTKLFAELYVCDEVSAADHGHLVDVACETLDYCNGNEDADLPRGDDPSAAYTPDVFSHLDDVTAFFSAMKLAAVIAVLVAMASIFALWVACRERGEGVAAWAGARMMVIAPIIVLIAVCVLAGWAMLDFNGMFNMLHSLFFASGTWLFPYDSLLICALPEPFWMAMGVLWGVLMLIVCLILIVVGAIVRRRYGPRVRSNAR